MGTANERRRADRNTVSYRLGHVLVRLSESRSRSLTFSAVLAIAAALIEAIAHTSFHSPALAPNLGMLLDSFVIAGFVFILTYVELSAVRERRLRVARDLKIVADLNHHIRNALSAIQYAAYSSQDKSKVDVINSAIDHIDGILHDLYPALGVEDQARRTK